MWVMKSHAFLLALLCVLCGLASPNHAASLQRHSGARIGASAVWRPAPEQLAAIRNKCGAGDPAKLGDCFISEMRTAGASPEAIAFAKSVADKGYGYLRELRETGRVSIAYVEYLFRANELEGVYLVNGLPPMLDVDDQSLFPSDDLAKNDSYLALLQQYPKLAIFPGDRFHTDRPVAKSLGADAREFDVSYVLRDSCHACAAIGELQLAFYFNGDGKFTGTRVVEVTQPIQSTAGNIFNLTLWSKQINQWRLTDPGDRAIVRLVQKEATMTVCAGPCMVSETWTFIALAKGTTDLEFLCLCSAVNKEIVTDQKRYVVVVN
jgi:hypothetical protein